MHFCKTCCASFSRKQTYEKHLLTLKHINRNKENNKEVLACICGKSYASREGLSRHRSVCSSKPNDQIIQYYEEQLVSSQNEKKAIEKEKEAQIEVLKHQIEELILAQNNHQTIIGTQVNITINAFGKENLDYITEKQCLKIANQVFNSVPTAAQIVFFNPDHPENHNIKIPNKKEPYAMIMKEDSTWEMTDRKKAIEKMTQKSYSVAESSYGKVYEKVNPSRRQNFQTFMDKMNEQDPELWRRFQQELEMKIIGATRS
jgi:hypothetical protein